MAANLPNQYNQSAKQIVERILETGKLSRQEHLQLVNIFLSDFLVSDEGRSQINRVFDELQAGRLKFTN
ncbi:MAG: hypothetical protein SAL07_02015 [Oscillatoria sp. PMC 1051.18]|uniref:hypothetical protein n=1 Tax=Oscillatoria salina TaxID=331517 RepID=UPI0013B9F17A|nr:hypothetical protein [Oscillatoria salina]MBZ8180781.1 hypothetical protein [Oscillatoria salina IIICB1]MEC4894128.1 hypothetical protein [Oscillatoria sp. PMC 1050.18]MEC5028661.1 hypothetical protein [Oscillatoria sp. PMC 1051.18]NET88233.1 hypothetical protein [Kamptonema sp. SIO1D9]